MTIRIGILTGGGDVSSLNSLIFSVRKMAVKHNVTLVGFINGWEGVLNKNYLILNNIEDHSFIGGTFLKTSRVNILHEENGIERANSILNDVCPNGLIIVGGDDTLSNSYYISDVPCVLISKTIDNDVGYIEKSNVFGENIVTNYFTLGYPTAVEKINSYVGLDDGIRTTAYSHERIMILESMGMDTGWLAISSTFGNPDFILIPEFPIDYNVLSNKIKNKYLSQHHVIIVISEGASFVGTGLLSANYDEQDAFGHPRFGGSSFILRDMLKKDLSKYFRTRNINVVNPSYLYRSGKPNLLDAQASIKLGKFAIPYLLQNLNEPHFLSIDLSGENVTVKPIPLSKFPQTKSGRFPKRYVDSRFYDENKYNITADARQYLLPMISQQHRNRISLKTYFNILNKYKK